jgi:hypothetical protein
MWTCRHCGEQHEDQFEVCWNCGTTIGADSPPATSTAKPLPGDDEAAPAKQATAGMTSLDLATLACRTVALVLFALAAYVLLTGGLALIATVLAPFEGYIGEDDWIPLLLLGLPSVGLGMIGIYYWNNADRIARRMVEDGAERSATVDLRISELTTVAFALAGLFLFVEAIREAVRLVFLMSQYGRNLTDMTPREVLRIPEFWTTVVQLAASLWLILGARGIVRAIHWLRQTDTRQPADTDAS